MKSERAKHRKKHQRCLGGDTREHDSMNHRIPKFSRGGAAFLELGMGRGVA